MKPAELISTLRTMGSQQDLGVIVRFLADHLYQAELHDGRLVKHSDIMGMREWLEEVAEAAITGAGDFSASTEVLPPERNRTPPVVTSRLRERAKTIDDTCPRCGHVHEGVGECGAHMGGAGFCRCELEVPA